MNIELKRLLDEIASSTNLSKSETDILMEQAFSLPKTSEEKLEAGRYLREAINHRKRPDINVKEQLGEASQLLNLAYIAKRYFNKDRTWLYQRINQTNVNGKPAAFTEEEIKKLSDSLAEISNKIHQISIQLTH